MTYDGQVEQSPWNIRSLGDLTPGEQRDYWEALTEDDREGHLSGFLQSHFFLNPRLEVLFLQGDGTFVPAAAAPRTAMLGDVGLNIVLERYWVHAMPGARFDLQLAIAARHRFADKRRELVSHTLAVEGVAKSYVNYLGEPVFQGLRVDDALLLDFVVTFVRDKTTAAVLAALKSPAVKTGLHLAGAYNPIFGAAATYVRGLVEGVAGALKNKAITKAHVGFHRSPGEMSIPLVAGTYVLIQPTTGNDAILGQELRLDRGRQRVVANGGELERNHLIMRIEESG